MSFFRREPDLGADERFFGRDRQGLVEMVVRMGALVRENLESAVRGLVERDEAAARAGAGHPPPRRGRPREHRPSSRVRAT